MIVFRQTGCGSVWKFVCFFFWTHKSRRRWREKQSCVWLLRSKLKANLNWFFNFESKPWDPVVAYIFVSCVFPGCFDHLSFFVFHTCSCYDSRLRNVCIKAKVSSKKHFFKNGLLWFKCMFSYNDIPIFPNCKVLF